MFQNATRFGIEGSQFMNVLGNLNVHQLTAPSAVHEQILTPNGSLDVPGVYTDSENYCGQLLRRGRGFPLYVPGPQRNLPREYQRQGVSIGDVGRVTPEGIFDFFFNIYLPADDPVNAEAVPEGFSPLKRYISRDIVYLDLERGSHVSTTSVQKQDVGSPSEYVYRGYLDRCLPASSGSEVNFMFDCNAPQGAVLALPHGSQAEKLENIEHMRQYAAKNAESWYKYINGERGRGLTNGALYLVTGSEKSRSWGMAAFQEVTTQAAFQLSFEPTTGDRYRWTASGPATTKASGSIPVDDDPLNQTLFIHGLSISLGTGVWGRLFKNVEVRQIVDSQLGRSSNEFVPYASQGFLFSWSLGFLAGGGTQGSKQCAMSSEDPNGVTVSEFPLTSTIFHPSQVINAYLLAKFPTATIVISHDDDWREIMRYDGEPSEMRSPVDLLQQICEQYVAIEEDGTIFLSEKDAEIRSTSSTATEEFVFGPPSSENSVAPLLVAGPATHTQQEPKFITTPTIIRVFPTKIQSAL
ncbi:hypothetical protein FB451DRAFT_194083 [Mycena latifolia]|nr:hypothetical protein FB451DRAFT_194083 [Mycena latifolia]